MQRGRFFRCESCWSSLAPVPDGLARILRRKVQIFKIVSFFHIKGGERLTLFELISTPFLSETLVSSERRDIRLEWRVLGVMKTHDDWALNARSHMLHTCLRDSFI
jgi:hypothetical protein